MPFVLFMFLIVRVTVINMVTDTLFYVCKVKQVCDRKPAIQLRATWRTDTGLVSPLVEGDG